jgi:hypothetical protein
MGEAKRRGGSRPITNLVFILPEEMSLEFRQRMAGVRKEDSVCFACGGPIITIDQLGVTVMRLDRDGGRTSAFACIPCEQGPREFLIEAWGRRNHDVKLTPEEVERAKGWALARAKAATETRQ